MGDSPVYAIDVCKRKSISSCRVGVDDDWTKLDVGLPGATR